MDVELAVQLVHEVDAAALVHPGVLLAGVEAEGQARADGEGLVLAGVEERSGVGASTLPALHRVQRLQRRRHLAGGEHADLEAVVRELGDGAGEHLGGAVDRVERARVGRGEAPPQRRAAPGQRRAPRARRLRWLGTSASPPSRMRRCAAAAAVRVPKRRERAVLSEGSLSENGSAERFLIAPRYRQPTPRLSSCRPAGRPQRARGRGSAPTPTPRGGRQPRTSRRIAAAWNSSAPVPTCATCHINTGAAAMSAAASDDAEGEAGAER